MKACLYCVRKYGTQINDSIHHHVTALTGLDTYLYIFSEGVPPKPSHPDPISDPKSNFPYPI